MIHLGGFRDLPFGVSIADGGGSCVDSSVENDMRHALEVCAQCKGWSEWVVLRREHSPIDSTYSACSLCHGDGTVPNKKHLRVLRRSRRRERRRHGEKFTQSLAAPRQYHGSNSRRSFGDQHQHHENETELSPSRKHERSQEIPIRAAQDRREDREFYVPVVRPANTSQPDVPIAHGLVTNVGRRSSRRAQEHNERLKRRLDDVEAWIRTSCEGSQFGPPPGIFVPVIEQAEPSTGNWVFESPHHTARYRRAVRDFQRHGLEDDFPCLRLSPPSVRNLSTRFHDT